MFRTVPVSIIRSLPLYTQQWYTACHTGLLTACEQAVNKPVWHIPLLCVQWKTPDDGQSICPKHVEFYSKNKLEKLVHLVGFIIRIYHDARSPERQISSRPYFALGKFKTRFRCYLPDPCPYDLRSRLFQHTRINNWLRQQTHLYSCTPCFERFRILFNTKSDTCVEKKMFPR